jgi:hypothetical protein
MYHQPRQIPEEHTRAWIEKSVKNRSIFVKIGEIDLVSPVFNKLVSESDFFKILIF